MYSREWMAKFAAAKREKRNAKPKRLRRNLRGA
jgi:hypothetical protein